MSRVKRRASAGAGVRSAPAVILALAGVVVGHALTYLLVLPHAHERAAVLRETGHAYFASFAELAVLAGAVALGVVFLRHLTTASRRRSPGMPGFASLASLQVVGFAAMEVTERVASGTPLAEFVRERLFVGLLVQVAVAWLLARIVQLVHAAAERVRTAGAPHRRVRAVSSVAPPAREPVAIGVVIVAGARAPPCASFAFS